jgi:hypothetical protein
MILQLNQYHPPYRGCTKLRSFALWMAPPHVTKPHISLSLANYRKRRSLTACRLGILDIAIETDRIHGDRSQPTYQACPLCLRNSIIIQENETHFLFECTSTQRQRSYYTNKIATLDSTFEPDQIETHWHALKSDNLRVHIVLGDMITALLRARKRELGVTSRYLMEPPIIRIPKPKA